MLTFLFRNLQQFYTNVLSFCLTYIQLMKNSRVNDKYNRLRIIACIQFNYQIWNASDT